MFGRKARRIGALEALTGADQAVIRCLDEQLEACGREAADRERVLRVYTDANAKLGEQSRRRQHLYLDVLEELAEVRAERDDLAAQLDELSWVDEQ